MRVFFFVFFKSGTTVFEDGGESLCHDEEMALRVLAAFLLMRALAAVRLPSRSDATFPATRRAAEAVMMTLS